MHVCVYVNIMQSYRGLTVPTDAFAVRLVQHQQQRDCALAAEQQPTSGLQAVASDGKFFNII